MKLIILIFLAFVACVVARPQDFDLVGHGRAIAGFGVGVGAVPVLGLGGGVVGLVTGGPKAALANGAYGARVGAGIAQEVGGQNLGYYNRGFYY